VIFLFARAGTTTLLLGILAQVFSNLTYIYICLSLACCECWIRHRRWKHFQIFRRCELKITERCY